MPEATKTHRIWTRSTPRRAPTDRAQRQSGPITTDPPLSRRACLARITKTTCLTVATHSAHFLSSVKATQSNKKDLLPPSYPDHTVLLIVRDAEGNERAIRSAHEWDVRREHILAHVQDVMGRLPGGERRVPLDVRELEKRETDGLLYRRITFAAEPGDGVPAWLIECADPSIRRRSGMVCLHQTIAIGKDEPAGFGGSPNLQYARALAQRGHSCIAPDYPGFGENRTDPYALGYASATMKGIWNHMRAVDALQIAADIDARRIGVIGHSLGGHNAVFLALFDPRVRAIVSSCGFNAFTHYERGNIAGWSHKGYMPRLRDEYQLDLKRVPFDFPELLAALAPRPVFVNAPLADDNFPVEGVRICERSARPVYALFQAEQRLVVRYPDALHDIPADVRQEAYAFLDSALTV